MRTRDARQPALLLLATTLALAGAALAPGSLRALELEAGGAPWSPYAPIRRPVPPAVDAPGWTENPVDAFVYSLLAREGLEPAPAVGRREWLRRVTFDLTGLPPAPEDIEAFLADPAADPIAFGKVVDRLLASPEYGEQKARLWLDVVRYADTDGYAIDGERFTIWRYRDYVIRSWNEDRPFDEFAREQIAGDVLGAADEASRRRGTIAASFLRLGPWEADNMVARDRRQDYLDEITSTTGTVFLGLTVGCARCHSHKYDPSRSRSTTRCRPSSRRRSARTARRTTTRTSCRRISSPRGPPPRQSARGAPASSRSIARA